MQKTSEVASTPPEMPGLTPINNYLLLHSYGALDDRGRIIPSPALLQQWPMLADRQLWPSPKEVAVQSERTGTNIPLLAAFAAREFFEYGYQNFAVAVIGNLPPWTLAYPIGNRTPLDLMNDGPPISEGMALLWLSMAW
ncbi:uncharacterized protein K452DRAFT_317727 [Aplosporella prunicola CBS 121167]|uniref:Uncharacterized protein n=1 Tax=Aplosporella prunicola CBS 121167 TaxID=1176127 RepID=A0A6A6BHJ9_9PEZI|nr:uncharacterized protein K452DRAFT_317727 [Aplosporella prunicola CBS 121167]KAF2142815.1 hypothetical protein K452DRAFT_317727 [Aplosporella prunicola CBS 121167]